MTLHNPTVSNAFAVSCSQLWTNWNTANYDAQARQNAIRTMITQMTAFMTTPNVEFAATSGWGSFSWSGWRLRLNQKYTAKDDIRYGKFIEFCSTIYHETRHAEQFFRIAQGLLNGDLTYPDATKAEAINAAGSTSLRDKVAMFGGGRVVTPNSSGATSAVAASAVLPSASTVAKWLSIPINVANAANTNKGDFTTFCSGAKPTWFHRNTLLVVNDWMRATYKKTYSEMDSFAQKEDDADGALRQNVYKMYRSLPEEHDAHSIEDVIDKAITALIGHADRKADRRSTFA